MTAATPLLLLVDNFLIAGGVETDPLPPPTLPLPAPLTEPTTPLINPLLTPTTLLPANEDFFSLCAAPTPLIQLFGVGGGVVNRREVALSTMTGGESVAAHPGDGGGADELLLRLELALSPPVLSDTT